MKNRRNLMVPLGLVVAIFGSAATVASPHSHKGDSNNLLNKVVASMGGAQRISDVKTQQIIVSEQRFDPEKTYKPGDDAKFMASMQYVMTRTFDKEQFNTEWSIDTDYPPWLRV